jgi:lipopolysaccharide/colanic/teichoic acid biosynthesis glycosyltransferase
MEESNSSLVNLSQSPKPIHAIFVPKVREPLLKRPLDVTLSGLMLILSPPVSLLIALAIKLEDGGSHFLQTRTLGKGRGSFQGL